MRKKQTPQLTEKCGALWDEFNPIGLADRGAGVGDEYASYVPHTAELIASGADKLKLTTHIENCVYVNLGLGRSARRKHDIEAFVQKLLHLSTQ